MTAKIEKIWIEQGVTLHQAIRIDVTNGRHYRVEIEIPCNAQKVGEAFIRLGRFILEDNFGEKRDI